MESENPHKLEFPEYKFWYESIRKDDVETMRRELDSRELGSSCVTRRNKLLNGKFCFKDYLSKTENKQMKLCSTQHVWHLVVTLCSAETIKLFISKGVQIQAKNNLHYNIIYHMILTAAYKPHIEDRMMLSYSVIMDNITSEDRCELLFHENNEGLRPLEFTMNVATTGLFQGLQL